MDRAVLGVEDNLGLDALDPRSFEGNAEVQTVPGVVVDEDENPGYEQSQTI